MNNGQNITVLINAVDNASKVFKNVADNMNAVGKQMQSIGTKMTAAVTLPLIGVAAGALKAAGDMEALEKGFSAVYKGAVPVTEQLEQLGEVAKLPGLGLQEAYKGSIRLQAIGFSAEKAKESLMVFGNAVATVGGGRVELERAIYGLQQMANTEFPLGEDLNIIKDAIPQVTPLLEEAFGASRSDELAEMGVKSKEIVDVLLTGLGKLPPVAGGMKNAFENLSDSIFVSLSTIGETINKTFNIEGLFNRIGDTIGMLADKFANLTPQMQKMILVGAGIAAAIGPLLLILGTLSVALAAISPLVIAITAVTGALAFVTFKALTDEGNNVVEMLKGVYDRLVAAWQFFTSFFGPILDVTRTNLMALWQTIQDQLLPTLQVFWEVHGNNIVAILKVLAGLLATTLLLAINGIIAALNIAINVFTGLMNIVNLLIAVFKVPFQAAIALITGDFQTFKDALTDVVDALKGVWDWAVKVYEKVKSVIGLGGKSSKKNVDDAVISPSGSVVSTNPQDWLIATKDPKTLGGGGETYNIYLQGNSFMGKEGVADQIAAELMQQLQYRHKFSS